MNKHFLKTLRDNMPESLKHVTGRIIRNELVKNKEFTKTMQLLEQREGLSKAEIENIQFNRLKETLIYSYNNVPYYNELFNEINFDPLKLKPYHFLPARLSTIILTG
jgi:hypothetical protein